MAEVRFDNRAGIFILYPGEGLNADLILMLAPGFDEETDRISLSLPNLKFIREERDDDNYINYNYKFGPKQENTLNIMLKEGDWRFGGIWINIPGLIGIHRIHDERVEFQPPPNLPPEEEQGYLFYGELNTALRAEAARQEALRAAARQKARNLAALKQTVAAKEIPTTGANWYYGPRTVVPNTVKGRNVRGLIGSFLTGISGTNKQQVAALKTQAGQGGRRKTQRRRRT